MKIYVKYSGILLGLMIIAINAMSQVADSTNVEGVLAPKHIGIQKETFVAFLLSIGLMFAGLYLPIAINFLEKNKFSTFITKARVAITSSIVFCICGLLIYVPDTKNILAATIQFSPDIEQGVGGFIMIGGLLSRMLTKERKVVVDENEKS